MPNNLLCLSNAYTRKVAETSMSLGTPCARATRQTMPTPLVGLFGAVGLEGRIVACPNHRKPIRHLAHLLDCRGASGRLLQEAGTQHLPRLAFHSPPTASVCSSRRLRPRRSSSSASRPPVGKSSLWTEKRGSENLWGKSRGQREIRRGGLFRRILTA